MQSMWYELLLDSLGLRFVDNNVQKTHGSIKKEKENYEIDDFSSHLTV